MAWQLDMTDEVRHWLHQLRKEDRNTADLITDALRMLMAEGPGLGRPLVDTVHHVTRLRHLKELRPGSSGRSEIRILFVFHGGRLILLLASGDKSEKWKSWYVENIAVAENRYNEWLTAQKGNEA